MKYERKRQKGLKFSFLGLLGSGIVLCMLMAVLLAVQRNVIYKPDQSELGYLDIKKQDLIQVDKKAETLIIWEDDPMGNQGLTAISEILSQMKVSFEAKLCKELTGEMLPEYQKIVLSVTHYVNMVDILNDLRNWIAEGGQLLILYPPDGDMMLKSLNDVTGIQELPGNPVLVEGLHFTENIMIGSDKRDFYITDPYESSLSLTLMDNCKVYLESVDQYPTPLLWSHPFKKGKVVFDNLGILDKAYRGFHCAAYSLLGDTCIYPVINGSVFYIDDFPSPIPLGDGTYITRDFNVDIEDFYTNIWWNDVYNLAKKYQIPYTALVIEEYSDQTEGTFVRNEDTQRYRYFGNMLLQAGGEIGLHGFNHMPLVLENFDYDHQFDTYVPWTCAEDMKNSLNELLGFMKELYPDETFQTYVPPSNIISEEGIDMLSTAFPQIRAIGSVYFAGDLAYEQEFSVSENGIVNTPRIISGYILNEYNYISAFSELTFHYVNTHFQHPDDVLDEDRGAALGWEKMCQNLTDYLDWLYSSAPDIRNLTGTEFGGSVQRYDYINFTQEETEKGIKLHLENFFDEAFFFLRLNCSDQMPSIKGGSIMEVARNLYLIDAAEPEVELIYQ